MLNRTDRAMVILSGGQDSTTCLFCAKEEFAEVHALTFNCSSATSELFAAKQVGEMAGVKSHEFLDIPNLLASDSSFFPGRNVLFLTLAANRAVVLETRNIFIGACGEDFDRYWDCREGFLSAMDVALAQGFGGMDDMFELRAPLLKLSKSATVHLADGMVGCMEALAFTHTCVTRSDIPCGLCRGCELRSHGFSEAGMADPLITRIERKELDGQPPK